MDGSGESHILAAITRRLIVDNTACRACYSLLQIAPNSELTSDVSFQSCICHPPYDESRLWNLFCFALDDRWLLLATHGNGSQLKDQFSWFCRAKKGSFIRSISRFVDCRTTLRGWNFPHDKADHQVCQEQARTENGEKYPAAPSTLTAEAFLNPRCKGFHHF